MDLADSESEIKGARERLCREVRDARRQAHGDDMRHACLYKGLCSSLREARRDEDEAERGDAARLQQLLERGHSHEVRIPSPILHREVVWIAVARVVEAATLAERHEGTQPIGRRSLEAHLEIAPRLAH